MTRHSVLVPTFLLGWSVLALTTACDASSEAPSDAATASAFDGGGFDASQFASASDGSSADGSDRGSDGSSSERDAASPDSSGLSTSFEDATFADSSLRSDSEVSASATGNDGILSGQCGEIDAVEVDSNEAFFFENHMDFPVRLMANAIGIFEAGTQALIENPNAGGSSVLSEAMAFEMLARCDGASLRATENEVTYQPPDSEKTDFVITLDGETVGVSVTRAFVFNPSQEYTASEAQRVIGHKLAGIIESTQTVQPPYQWRKQILVVLTPSEMNAAIVRTVWEGLDTAMRADTIVVVTVTSGEDDFVYTNTF